MAVSYERGTTVPPYFSAYCSTLQNARVGMEIYGGGGSKNLN